MSVNKSVFSPSKERAKTLNRIFQSALEKANQLHMDEPKFECGPIFVTDDTKIIQEGIMLTFNHFQKGTSTFSAYAEAMINDHGQYVIPYLKSCYLAVKYHPGAAIFESMDNADTVESFDVESLYVTADDESSTESDKLKNVWVPAGVSLSAQRVFMIQTQTPWHEMEFWKVHTMLQSKLKRLLIMAEENGQLPQILEEIPGITELIMMEQDLVQMAEQIVLLESVEILISRIDHSEKALLNSEASEMILEQDMMSWIEDLNTALYEM